MQHDTRTDHGPSTTGIAVEPPRSGSIALSDESTARAEQMSADFNPTRAADDLTPTGGYATRLRAGVQAYVHARRDDGEAPQRVLVELKAMRPHGSSVLAATWLRLHDEAITTAVMRWFLEAYFPPAAPSSRSSTTLSA